MCYFINLNKKYNEKTVPKSRYNLLKVVGMLSYDIYKSIGTPK